LTGQLDGGNKIKVQVQPKKKKQILWTPPVSQRGLTYYTELDRHTKHTNANRWWACTRLWCHKVL